MVQHETFDQKDERGEFPGLALLPVDSYETVHGQGKNPLPFFIFSASDDDDFDDEDEMDDDFEEDEEDEDDDFDEDDFDDDDYDDDAGYDDLDD